MARDSGFPHKLKIETATARTLAEGTQQLNATIDSIEYTITEESVRRQLQLADASGINMLQNDEIFAGLQNIGSKSGGWDQFGSNIATALICLSTGRDFNFSKLIFDGMISNLKSKSKFLMYPRFLQMILNIQTENKNLFVPVLLTKKIFGNMKRSFQGIHRPLLPAMLTIDAGQPQPSAAPTPSQPVPTPTPSHVQIPTPPITSTPPSTQPPPLTQTVQSTPTLTQPVQSTTPPPQPSSVQLTSSPPPIQPVQPTPPITFSSPPITTIPDTQPTHPPSPQIPSPPHNETEGPSFEPSYHMSPPPSHEPEIQPSRTSEESEQLRNLLDLVPRLESRVESLEEELNDTKQTLGTAVLKLIERFKKHRIIVSGRREKERKLRMNRMQRVKIKNTAQLIWYVHNQSVEKRFGGNAATRKTQRNLLKQQYENFSAPSSEMLDQTFDRLQKLLSQLELLDEKLSQEDVNQKLLRSLSPEWNTHAVV
ncbi:hypothetical protein Tco_1369469 [Tanacetum coccineum]